MVKPRKDRASAARLAFRQQGELVSSTLEPLRGSGFGYAVQVQWCDKSTVQGARCTRAKRPCRVHAYAPVFFFCDISTQREIVVLTDTFSCLSGGARDAMRSDISCV